MRIAFLTASLLALSAAAFAADDPLATRYNNTTIALGPDGSTTRLFYRADKTFVAKRGSWQSDGTWSVTDGKVCLSFKITHPGIGDQECAAVEPHAIGDVWLQGHHHLTLVSGLALDNSPEVLAALAAASRVGNTIVAKDPDGTETRLYWRPDHTFSATRPTWKTEGTWAVKGSSLFLHYNIARPGMGTDEEMKGASPRKVGEVWGMADRQVTMLEGEQLAQPK